MRKCDLTVHIREVVGSSPSPPILPLPVSAWYAFWAVREDTGARKRRILLYHCPHGWAASLFPHLSPHTVADYTNAFRKLQAYLFDVRSNFGANRR